MRISTQKRLAFVIIFIILILSLTLPYIKTSSILAQTENPYSINQAFPNLSFSHPVGLVPSNDGSNRLFVVEQEGTIRVFENNPTATSSSLFLDIQSKVLFGGEQGLVGFALHPNYEQNRYFYVDYIADNPPRTVIARYQTSSTNPNLAMQTSEFILLQINQPFSNHNGGQLSFGDDGYLYIGMGDGGSAGDPQGNAQNLSSLLGKILRIDIDNTSQNQNYSIPQDNPYKSNSIGYREEIYAYGFRNPWRFSFDSANSKLWVGDVGQSQREEIDIVEKGKNYGWNIMEGTIPYAGGSQTGLELPIWEYSHDEGNAIVGGYIYHGSTLTELQSKYIYGDYGSGKIWALQYNTATTPQNTLQVDTTLNISSFGIDEQNELFICSLEGKIYSLKSTITPSPTPSTNPTINPTQTPLPTSTSTSTSNTTPTQTPNQTTPTTTNQPSPTPQTPRSENNLLPLAIIIAIISIILVLAIIFRRYTKNHKVAPTAS
jgi:glucose/arabinose dehydrogenase